MSAVLSPRAAAAARRQLPLITLYLSHRCNSRCVSCDYWRHGAGDMTLESVARLLPSLESFGTRLVLISGGEPLVNPEWPGIAALLRSHGLDLWLLTSGLSLAKHAEQVARWFGRVTVSLDGTNADTYAAIRGVNAFEPVCEGIRSIAARGVETGLRVTVQRRNHAELADFVRLGQALGVRQVSFLPADVANPHVFGREAGFVSDLALRAQDLPRFAELIDRAEVEFAEEFASGFIAENPEKLRRLVQYFAAVLGRADYPPVRCNAPEFSAVIQADGDVRPCFFIPGTTNVRAGADVADALDGESMRALRHDIRAGARRECATCVCSVWREGGAL